MGGACGTYDGKDRCVQDFGGVGGGSQGKRPLTRLELDRRILLKWPFELKCNIKYSYSFISTSIYNSVHHTCEYNQLQNRSNHFDTTCIEAT